MARAGCGDRGRRSLRPGIEFLHRPLAVRFRARAVEARRRGPSGRLRSGSSGGRNPRASTGWRSLGGKKRSAMAACSAIGRTRSTSTPTGMSSATATSAISRECERLNCSSRQRWEGTACLFRAARNPGRGRCNGPGSRAGRRARADSGGAGSEWRSARRARLRRRVGGRHCDRSRRTRQTWTSPG